MAGRRTFVAGEVLTASNINSFLMGQVVAIFANAGARTAAIPSPVQGNITYLQDSDSVEKWNGSAWVPVAPREGVIVTKQQFFTGTRTQSINDGDDYVIPDTEISHAVSKVGNSVLLFGQLVGSYPGTGLADSLMGGSLSQNGVSLNRGDAAGNRNSVSAYNIGPFSSDNFSVSSVFLMARYTPPDTTARTYGVQINSGRTGTWYINRSRADDNASTRPRGATGLILMEVTD
jgi:hypothetical protein